MMFQWWTPVGRAILRDRGEQAAKARRAFLAVIRCLTCEGWNVEELSGQRMRISSNGEIYVRSSLWLTECDYSDVPSALSNDLFDIMRDEGFCNG